MPTDDTLIAMPNLLFDVAPDLTASVVVQHLRMRNPFVPEGPLESVMTAGFLSLQWNFRHRRIP
jgi:hypothetical protein